MAKKFYVVWQGRETGIFTDWNTCKKQVDAFAGAKYKSFKTRHEAEAAFSGNAAPASSMSTSRRHIGIVTWTFCDTHTRRPSPGDRVRGGL